MANLFFQSKINPTKFSIMNFVDIPQYVSRFIDKYLYSDTIETHEEQQNFCQPWLSVDPVRNQFSSNYGPITLNVWNARNEFEFSQDIEPALPDLDRPGFNLYNMDYDLAALAGRYGCHYFTLDLGGGGLILVSEPFDILRNGYGTLLLEYSNAVPFQDMVFKRSNGTDFFSPALRIPGRLKPETVEYVDTLYFDQVHNATMPKSIPFDTYTLTHGRSKGVPPWHHKKVGRIVGCDSWKVDGLLMAKTTENQVWEKTEEEDYPLFGYRLKVAEKLNHASLVYETTTPVVGLNSMMAIVETKGFGIQDQGGNFLEIEQTL